MDNKNVFKIAMALHKIAMIVSEEDLKKIGKYLNEIEEAVKEEIKDE